MLLFVVQIATFTLEMYRFLDVFNTEVLSSIFGSVLTKVGLYNFLFILIWPIPLACGIQKTLQSKLLWSPKRFMSWKIWVWRGEYRLLRFQNAGAKSFRCKSKPSGALCSLDTLSEHVFVYYSFLSWRLYMEAVEIKNVFLWRWLVYFGTQK